MCWEPVCCVAGRKRTLEQYLHNVKQQQVANAKVVVHHLGQTGEKRRELGRRSHPVGHCGKPMLAVVKPNKQEQVLHGLLHADVLQRALVLRNDALVRVGQVLHQQEHEEVKRLFKYWLDIHALGRNVLVVEIIADRSALAHQTRNVDRALGATVLRTCLRRLVVNVLHHGRGLLTLVVDVEAVLRLGASGDWNRGSDRLDWLER